MRPVLVPLPLLALRPEQRGLQLERLLLRRLASLLAQLLRLRPFQRLRLRARLRLLRVPLRLRLQRLSAMRTAQAVLRQLQVRPVPEWLRVQARAAELPRQLQERPAEQR